MQFPPPAVFHDKYQWEIWKNTAGKSAKSFPQHLHHLHQKQLFGNNFGQNLDTDPQNHQELCQKITQPPSRWLVAALLWTFWIIYQHIHENWWLVLLTLICPKTVTEWSHFSHFHANIGFSCFFGFENGNFLILAIVKNDMEVFRRGPDSDWQVVVLLPLLSPITDQLPSCPQKKLQLP